MYMNKSRQPLTVIVAIGIILGVFMTSTNLGQAAVPFIGPFGGKIIKKTSCTCPVPYGKLIVVGLPKPGVFMVVDGLLGFLGVSKVYDYKDFSEGNWVLGLSKPIPIPCNKWEVSLTGVSCKPKGAGFFVSKVGTSGGGLPGIGGLGF